FGTEVSVSRPWAISSCCRCSPFSALSSSSLAASHSSRVPILWSVIVSLLLAAKKALLFCNYHEALRNEAVYHHLHEGLVKARDLGYLAYRLRPPSNYVKHH